MKTNEMNEGKTLLNFEWDEDINIFPTEQVENQSTENNNSDDFEKELKKDEENKTNLRKNIAGVNSKEEENDITVENDENEIDLNDINIKADKDLKTLNFDEIKKHIFSEEIEEDVFSDTEKFINAVQKEIDYRLEQQIEELVNAVGEYGKAFLSYVKNGGDVKTFFETLQNSVSAPTYKEDDEYNNKEVIRYYLKNIKNVDDDEYIEETINSLIEKGSLDKYAKKYSEYIEEENKRKIEMLEENQRKQKIELEKARENYKIEFKKHLYELNDIYGYNLTKKEKDELFDYIFRPNVKEGNNFITKFNKDLNELFNDKNKIILLAKLMKDNFTFDSFIKALETKVVKDTKQKINNPQINKGKSIIDFF